MTGPVRLATATFLLCGLLAMQNARAADGRIHFSGAVVVPTCVARGEPLTAIPADGAALQQPQRFACGASRAGPARISMYELSVLPLSRSDAHGSTLLEYFVGTLSAHARASATLLTRTYQ